jgi:hypothetical protein
MSYLSFSNLPISNWLLVNKKGSLQKRNKNFTERQPKRRNTDEEITGAET